MAVPKKRTTLTRKRTRRTHYKAYSNARGTCTNCKSVKLNFHVCDTCGYYKGKLYLNTDK